MSDSSMNPDEQGTITDEGIMAVLKESDLTTTKTMNKTLVMGAKLPNGFEIVTTAAPVDPKTFDRGVGEKMCFANLKQELADYLGFLAHEVDDPVAQVLDQ
jgi:hypothetical protein